MSGMKLSHLGALLLTLHLPAQALAAPQYANDETKRVIESMVEAHGGIDIWRDAPSIRFDDVMHNNYHKKENFAWWVAHEVIDQKTRQAWQHWPMNDARIGYDGEQVWSTNWQLGNPSAMMVHFFYYFVNLPWITQDDNVILGETTKYEWPGFEEELLRVEMTFDGAPSVGKSSKDLFILYMDPNDYRLVAYQYGSGYQPLLDVMNMPPGKEIFGPLWRVITKYEEVDGLLFPSAWRTMPGPDERIVGNHVILNIDIAKPFEYENSKQPDGSVVFDGPLRTN